MANGSTNPATQAARRWLILLDKTLRTTRTYGPGNELSQRFLRLLFEGVVEMLGNCGALTLVVQRFVLYVGDEPVYQNDSPSESLAFRLHSVGIRELRFGPDLSASDLGAFVHTLAADQDQAVGEDDLVTRLWSKDLKAISLVTAEEVIKSSEADQALVPQNSSLFGTPVSSLPAIHAVELKRTNSSPPAAVRPHPAGVSAPRSTPVANASLPADKPRATSPPVQPTGSFGEARQAASTPLLLEEPSVSEADGTLGSADRDVSAPLELPAFSVSPDELAALAQDIRTESERDQLAYLLDMIRSIAMSQTSPVIMSELLATCQQMLTDLVRIGEWKALTALVSFLREAQCRADLPSAIKGGVSRLLASLNEPDYLNTVAGDLNASPGLSTEGLLTFFLSLEAAAVPVLCQVLAQFKAKHHRLVLCDALPVLARDNVAPLQEALTDSRWFVVRNALYIIGKMKNPDLAGSVESLCLHKDKRVRREALKTLGLLRSTTEAHHLVAVLQDTDEGIRLSALNLLKTPTDRIPWSAWEPVVSSQEFTNRSTLELRLTLQALGRTAGEAGVQYFRRLLLQRLWPHRKRRIPLAILAAETLGQMDDPSVIPVLEAGTNRFNRAIRDACRAALVTATSRAGLRTKEH